MKIKLPYNLENVPRSDTGEIIPKGFYLGEITRMVELSAKVDKGTGPQVLVAIRIEDAEDPKNAPYIKATIIDTISLLEQVAWKVGQFADAVLGRKVSGADLDPDEYVGKPVAVRVYSEEWEGRNRMRVERYLPVSQWHKPAKTAAPAAVKPGNAAAKTAAPVVDTDDDSEMNLS